MRLPAVLLEVPQVPAVEGFPNTSADGSPVEPQLGGERGLPDSILVPWRELIDRLHRFASLGTHGAANAFRDEVRDQVPHDRVILDCRDGASLLVVLPGPPVKQSMGAD